MYGLINLYVIHESTESAMKLLHTLPIFTGTGTLKMDQNVLNNGLISVSKTGIFCYTTTSIRTKQVQPLSYQYSGIICFNIQYE